MGAASPEELLATPVGRDHRALLAVRRGRRDVRAERASAAASRCAASGRSRSSCARWTARPTGSAGCASAGDADRDAGGRAQLAVTVTEDITDVSPHRTPPALSRVGHASCSSRRWTSRRRSRRSRGRWCRTWPTGAGDLPDGAGPAPDGGRGPRRARTPSAIRGARERPASRARRRASRTSTTCTLGASPAERRLDRRRAAGVPGDQARWRDHDGQRGARAAARPATWR